LTVQGNSITLPSGKDSYAAIDTGTTLIGGPQDTIAAIYASIPGSEPASGDYEGYYSYPCDTNVNVTMSFGGRSWSVSSADFVMTKVSGNTCIGGFFATESTPAWIVGDTFLKNVYSVFRYNPPSVGFADLSETALAMNAWGYSPHRDHRKCRCCRYWERVRRNEFFPSSSRIRHLTIWNPRRGAVSSFLDTLTTP